jgi:hypothetical protein
MANEYTGWGSPFFNFLGDMWKDRPLPADLGSRTTLLNMQGGSTSPFAPLIAGAIEKELAKQQAPIVAAKEFKESQSKRRMPYGDYRGAAERETIARAEAKRDDEESLFSQWSKYAWLKHMTDQGKYSGTSVVKGLGRNTPFYQIPLYGSPFPRGTV